MDPLSLLQLARTLVDIDSTTGQEGDCGRWLAAYLRRREFRVEELPVSDNRFNVLATIDPPQVVLSTHFDCVPPFMPSREASGVLFGRGACDAKGILAAQISALERLRTEGVREVGALFLVGEERGSDGARVANAAPNTCRFLINGEPTDSRLGLATRGALRVKLTAAGRAAHSSFPDAGESAIEKLLDALVRLRSIAWPTHEPLGRTHYTIGLIGGGIAPNVIPPHAEAEVMFRTVGPAADRTLRAGGGSGGQRPHGRRARSACRDARHGAGLRDRRFPVHDRHSVSGSLGHAAPVRSWLDSRGAHGSRAGPGRGAAQRGRQIRGARNRAARAARVTRVVFHLRTRGVGDACPKRSPDLVISC